MKYFLSLMTILFSCVTIKAQLHINSPIPQDPNVAALSKYVATPVSEYTGVPNISIPLYTVVEDNVSLPISISYHSGGIRLGEEASNVGLGWTLNAGGMISRSVEDVDDLKPNLGFARTTPFLPDPPTTGGVFNSRAFPFATGNNNCSFLKNGVMTNFEKPTQAGYAQRKDLIPDTFFFNFNGYSGSFVINGENGGIWFSKKIDLKMELLTDDTFVAITPDGTKYIFDMPVTNHVNSTAFHPIADHISAWYLTKIITPRKTVINLTYETREDIRPLATFQQVYLKAVGPNTQNLPYESEVYAGAQVDTKGVYLSEINYTSGKVKLVYSDPLVRRDIVTGYTLDAIEIFNTPDGTGEPVKNFSFDYSYFGSYHSSSNAPATDLTPNNSSLNYIASGSFSFDYSGDVRADLSNSHLKFRLKLNSITEDQTKTHSFEYHGGNSSNAPSKTSTSQDHWGFYNGVTNLHTFIPKVISNFGVSSVPEPGHDADRHADEAHATMFTLNKIIYPTKGYTTFEHELHSFDNSSSQVPAVMLSEEFKSTTSEGAGLVTGTFELTSPATVNFECVFHLYDWPGKNNPTPTGANQYVYQTFAYAEILDSDGNYLKNSNNITIGRSGYQLQENPNYGSGITNPATAFYEQSFFLPAGIYTVKANFTDDITIKGESKATISWLGEAVSSENQFAVGGGLRVKSITDHDSDGNTLLKRNFNYHYKDTEDGVEVTKSYGTLRNRPTYTGYNIHAHDHSGPDSRYGTKLGPNGGLPDPFFIAAKSTSSLHQDMGSYVGYDQVTVSYVDHGNNDNGKKIFKFYNDNRYGQSIFITFAHRFPRITNPINGLQYAEETYKNNGNGSYTLVSKIERGYTINGISSDVCLDNWSSYRINNNTSSQGCFQYENTYDSSRDYILGAYKIAIRNYQNTCAPEFYSIQLHPYYSDLIQHTQTKETVFDDNGLNPVTKVTNYSYDSPNHYQLTSTDMIGSKGEVISSKIYYPDDVALLTPAPTSTRLQAIERLQSGEIEHRINQPIQTETNNNGSVTVLRTNFKTWAWGGTQLTLPEEIQTGTGSTTLETRAIYHAYDEEGNPLDVTNTDGIRSSYIWGYNKTLPIAQVAGKDHATFTSAVSSAINALTGYSNGINDLDVLLSSLSSFDASAKTKWQTFNDNLRSSASLDGALVTTYTYDRLVGMTSQTDPNGITIYYEYDDQNRLKLIKDHDGNIIKKNEYRYQTTSN